MLSEKPELIVIMDSENLLSSKDLQHTICAFVQPILQFLQTQFRVLHACAYTLSKSSEVMEQCAKSIEIKYVDALLPYRGKASVEVCMAMDAVRLAMQHPQAIFCVLAGAENDFATMAAYLRRCLHKRVIAFGSDESPNPYLAQEASLYLPLQSAFLWERKVMVWLHRKPTAAQSSFLQKLLYLIEDLQLPSACPVSVIEEQIVVKQCAQKLLALGCTLSENRRWVLRWGNKIQASLDQTRDPFVKVAEVAQFSTEMEEILEIFLRAFKRIKPLHFPLPVATLQSAIDEEKRALPKAFKRQKLSALLKKLDFELNKSKDLILPPESTNALALCQQAQMPVQSSLF